MGMTNFEKFCVRIVELDGIITLDDVLEFGYDEEHYDMASGRKRSSCRYCKKSYRQSMADYYRNQDNEYDSSGKRRIPQDSSSSMVCIFSCYPAEKLAS